MSVPVNLVPTIPSNIPDHSGLEAAPALGADDSDESISVDGGNAHLVSDLISFGDEDDIYGLN